MNRVLGCVFGVMLIGIGTANAELKVGDSAPDFALQGSDGSTHALSELTGKTVVIAWFPKAFTSG